MKLEKRKDFYRLGNKKGGIYFQEWQISKLLGFTVLNKKSVEIILNEFCEIDGVKISRKDNPEVYFKANTYEIKNGRHYYHY